MTMNPLPPQAYTKETLGKAFAWLQAQPENIKEFATSPDILVSLYLKAKLNGVGALERPSIQNFKNELKSLAGMMGEFEVMEPTAASEAMLNSAATRFQMNPPAPQVPLQTSFQIPTPTPPAPVAPATPAAPTRQYSAQPAAAPTAAQPATATARHAEVPRPETSAGLDAQSEFMIREVKVAFNLSSDQEALRLLIAAGFKSLQKL